MNKKLKTALAWRGFLKFALSIRKNGYNEGYQEGYKSGSTGVFGESLG